MPNGEIRVGNMNECKIIKIDFVYDPAKHDPLPEGMQCRVAPGLLDARGDEMNRFRGTIVSRAAFREDEKEDTDAEKEKSEDDGSFLEYAERVYDADVQDRNVEQRIAYFDSLRSGLEEGTELFLGGKDRRVTFRNKMVREHRKTQVDITYDPEERREAGGEDTDEPGFAEFLSNVLALAARRRLMRLAACEDAFAPERKVI